MNILIDINHPGQVHLFKHAAWQWQADGHRVLMVGREKDVTMALLKAYEFDYVAGTTRKPGLLNLGMELVRKTALLTKLARQFHPDLFISLGSPPAAWAAKLSKRPHIAFTDTEHSVEQYMLYAPFTKVIYTPSCFTKELGPKQRRYAGYHELAYLHPNRYTPSKQILATLNLREDEPFFVVRFVTWQATHDIGQKGVTSNDKAELLRLLSERGKVILTSEAKDAPELWGVENVQSTAIPPTEIHNLLYYANLYVGEGGTMATEAALLGTPSVFINPLHGGNWQELEEQYSLMYSFRNTQLALPRIQMILNQDPKELKEEWHRRLEQLLKDKIDVTALIVRTVEELV